MKTTISEIRKVRNLAELYRTCLLQADTWSLSTVDTSPKASLDRVGDGFAACLHMYDTDGGVQGHEKSSQVSEQGFEGTKLEETPRHCECLNLMFHILVLARAVPITPPSPPRTCDLKSCFRNVYNKTNEEPHTQAKGYQRLYTKTLPAILAIHTRHQCP